MWRRRRSSFAKGIGLGAVLGVTAILIHGFTDFNLQIPANAVYFTALAMLGVVVLGRAGRGEERGEGGGLVPTKRDQGEEKGRVPGKAGRLKRLGPSVAALLAVFLFVPAFHDGRGFHYLGEYRRARSDARNVERAFPALEARLEKAVNASPRSEFRIELARLYTEMARVANDSGRDEDREAFCDKAVAGYGLAIAANPAHASNYYETGLVYLLSNYPLMTYADRAKTYFRAALEFKPADDFLNLNIVFLYFNWWPTLEEAERTYALGLYRQAVARDPGFRAKLETRWKQSFQTTDRLSAILAEIR
ncbi:MAG: hypothetical protein NT147_10565 [Candidatus Aminicenantes bacterium]|nr:hypothetical protein [Candidatus Aminicenantes bacterium]